jgi:hypothetical protein
LDWSIRNNNKNIFRAVSNNSGFSWGELVTIKKSKNKLLLNSICDPDERPSFFSFGQNRKNILTFLKHLDNVINKVHHEEIPRVEIKEWSFKNSVTRVLIYFLCLFLVLAGLMILYFERSFGGVIMGLLLVSFGAGYIYLDLKVLNEKRKRKTEPLISYDEEK